MKDLFIFLTLCSFLLLIIGFINPNLSLFWYNKTRSRKTSFFIYVAAIVMFFTFFGIASETDEVIKTDNVTVTDTIGLKSDTLQKNTVKEKHIIKSVEEFKSRFNKFSREQDLDIYINNVEIASGEVKNTFTYMFSKHLGVVGSIHKSDGSIESLTLIGSGDGSFESGSNIIICMAIMITSVDPNLSANGRGKILEELKVLGSKDVDFTNLNTQTTKNGYKYILNINELTGIFFTITHT